MFKGCLSSLQGRGSQSGSALVAVFFSISKRVRFLENIGWTFVIVLSVSKRILRMFFLFSYEGAFSLQILMLFFLVLGSWKFERLFRILGFRINFQGRFLILVKFFIWIYLGILVLVVFVVFRCWMDGLIKVFCLGFRDVIVYFFLRLGFIVLRILAGLLRLERRVMYIILGCRVVSLFWDLGGVRVLFKGISGKDVSAVSRFWRGFFFVVRLCWREARFIWFIRKFRQMVQVVFSRRFFRVFGRRLFQSLYIRGTYRE